MIYNICIYGEIEDATSLSDLGINEIHIEWYNPTLLEIKTDTQQIIDGKFQFNLGNNSINGLNHSTINGESIRVFIINNINEVYSDYINIEKHTKHTNLIQYNITSQMIQDYVKTVNAPNAESELTRIVSDKYIIEEDNKEIYSYFSISNEAPEIIQEGNGSSIEFIPEVDGIYTILQRGYNSTTGDLQEKIIQLEVLSNYTETLSIDYIYYTKKNKVIQIELPEYITETLILDSGFYFENGKLLGKHNKLKPLEMLYSRGKVIIKTQVGDILDY